MTWLVASTVGCVGPGASDSAGGRHPAEDGAPGVLEASCAPTAHPLRARCRVTLAEAGPATVALATPGAPTRRFVSAEPATEHEILAWALHPESAYTWEIGDRDGTLTTGSLPDSLAAAAITVTGEARGFDVVAQPLSCPDGWYFVMIDPTGTIVWFERSAIYDQRAWDWSEEDQTLLVASRNAFEEWSLGGELLLRLDRGEHFAHELHHDVARWGRFTYLLQEYPNRPHDNLDLVEVFDGTTSLGAFRLEDHFDVAVDTAREDWAHTNGINPTADGEMIVSLHHLDTVLGFDADPASPSFLDLTFRVNGSERGLADPPPDFAPAEGSVFRSQHCASRDGDALILFDNHGRETSRGLRLALDPASGTWSETREWRFDEVCPIQGGAYGLPGGGVMITCPSTGEGWAFAEDGTTPEWTVAADCGGPHQRRSAVIKIVPLRVR